MEIKDNKIEGVAFKATPKNTQLFVQGKLDTLIIHYTAGGSPESSITTLTDPNTKASAHLVVARDGTITQLVPFNTIAWHAGPSQYGDRVGFNQYSIGIEIDNAGILEKRGDKYFSWFGRAYDEKDVVYAVHRNQKNPTYWHAYTEKQIQVVEELCHLLVKTYKLKFILGHEEISPGRKVDPGPAFPLDKLRERIFGGSRDSDKAEGKSSGEGTVIADLLNIRESASINSNKVTQPLKKNQKVKILAAKDGWYQVSTEVTGWVSAKFIK